MSALFAICKVQPLRGAALAFALLMFSVTAQANVVFQLTFTDAAGTGWNDDSQGYGAQARAGIQKVMDGIGSELPYNSTVKIEVYAQYGGSFIAGAATDWDYPNAANGNLMEAGTWGVITGEKSRPAGETYDAKCMWNFGMRGFTGSDGLLAYVGLTYNHETMHMLGCFSYSPPQFTRFDMGWYDSGGNPQVLNGARNPAANPDNHAFYRDVNGNQYNIQGDLMVGIYTNSVWKDQHRLVLKTMGYKLAPRLAGSSVAGGVSLNWTAFTWANGYVLKRATTRGGPYTTIYSGPDTSFTDSPAAGQTYYYVASYTKDGVEDGNSLELAATIFAGSPAKVTATTTGSQFAPLWGAGTWKFLTPC